MREVRRGRSKVQGGAGTGSGVAKGDGRRRGPPLSPPVCSTACLLPLPCTQRLLCSAAARHSLYEAREQVHPVDRGVQRQRLGQLDNVLDLQGGPGWGCSGLKGGKQRDRGTRGSSTLRPRCCCASAGSNTPAGPPPPFSPPPPPPHLPAGIAVPPQLHVLAAHQAVQGDEDHVQAVKAVLQGGPAGAGGLRGRTSQLLKH